MEIEEFRVGDRVEIEVNKNTDKLSFQSEIIAVLDDNRVIISEITHNDQSVGFSDLDRMSFIHLGSKLHRWVQPSIHLVRYKKEIYHCVTLTGSGSPYNRRESFRMYVGNEYPICYPTSLGIQKKDVLVKDISTGGIAFILSDQEDSIPMNKKFRLHFTDDHFEVDLHAEVIRTVALEEQHAVLYGCRFLNPEAVIGRYIMHKQGQKLKEMRS